MRPEAVERARRDGFHGFNLPLKSYLQGSRRPGGALNFSACRKQPRPHPASAGVANNNSRTRWMTAKPGARGTPKREATRSQLMSTGSIIEMERKPDAGRKRLRRLLSTALTGGVAILAATGRTRGDHL